MLPWKPRKGWLTERVVMIINTNLAAQTTASQLSESSVQLSKSLARLSSGSKLLSPDEDAAGLAVSIRFGAQINRIKAASNNVGNAISYTQTQDGFLKKVTKAMDRMSELAVLSQDVTKTNSDRSLYDQEFQTLGQYVLDIGHKDFNGVSLFDGVSRAVTTDGDSASFSMSGINVGSSIYTTATASSISTTTTAAAALSNVKAAISQISADRGTVGATMARLVATNEQLTTQRTTLGAADGQLRDVDVAEESTRFARYNILVQAGTAMLTQANSIPQMALRLLG